MVWKILWSDGFRLFFLSVKFLIYKVFFEYLEYLEREV